MLRKKKLWAFILSAAMLASMLGGCTKGDDALSAGSDAGEPAGTDEGGSGQETPDAGLTADNRSNAMGRYVEETIDVSSYVSRAFGVTRLENDNLVILDAYSGMIVSEDNGTTWESAEIPGMGDISAFNEDNYIWDMKAGQDGTVAVLYSAFEEVENNVEFSDDELAVFYPDGTICKAVLAKPESGTSISNIFLSPSGEVFGIAQGNGPYLIDIERGSLSRYLTGSAHLDFLQFQGDYLLMLSKEEGIQIYDRQTESYLTDETLSDFMKEYYLNSDYNVFETFSVYFILGEENCIYVAGKKGLHRHVLGGSAMELVIDGDLSSFSNPSMELYGVTMLPDNMFLALFSGGKAVRFSYRDDIPAVPEDRLAVYSLEDDDTVRLAIAKYQTDHPEAFIEYEIGIEEGSAVTREDAVKNLNTRMMSGEGPDILIMDGLPIDSYVERGLLLDINSYVDEINANSPLMPGVLNSFSKDGHIYMLPASFQISVLVGDADTVNGIGDLDGLAKVVEDIKRENPEKEVIGLYSEEAALRWFMAVSIPSWKTEDGGLNHEQIKTYLENVKRIYKTANEGISDSAKQTYQRKREMDVLQYLPTYDTVGQYTTSYAMKNMVILAGSLASIYNYHELNSFKRLDGLENTVIAPMNGQSSNVMIPYTITGISSVCKNPALAADFLTTLLSEDVQELMWNGFSVNEQALRVQVSAQWGSVGSPQQEGKGPGDPYSSIGFSGANGEMIGYEIYLPTEAEAKEMFDLLNRMDTVYFADPVIEDAILTVGVPYLQGSISLDEAVNDIETRISIYLAE